MRCNFMIDIAPILKSLGMLDSEVRVYLATLELGPSTVLDIAKHTKLSRPATYTAIDALTARGLMSAVQRAKKRLFAAEHPDRLLAYAKRQEHELEAKVADLARAIPDLALRVGGEKPIVKSYEGKGGLQAIIEDMRSTHPERLDEITNVDAMRSVLSDEDLAPLRKEYDRIRTNIRGLYAGSARPSAADARLLPPELASFKGTIEIYDNKVAFVTFGGNIHSVIIENSDIAETMRALFGLAWEAGKHLPKPVEVPFNE
jgi:HTH-type transcriptional regulator, sugar sensing transcriptional regulator